MAIKLLAQTVFLKYGGKEGKIFPSLFKKALDKSKSRCYNTSIVKERGNYNE